MKLPSLFCTRSLPPPLRGVAPRNHPSKPPFLHKVITNSPDIDSGAGTLYLDNEHRVLADLLTMPVPPSILTSLNPHFWACHFYAQKPSEASSRRGFSPICLFLVVGIHSFIHFTTNYQMLAVCQALYEGGQHCVQLDRHLLWPQESTI